MQLGTLERSAEVRQERMSTAETTWMQHLTGAVCAEPAYVPLIRSGLRGAGSLGAYSWSAQGTDISFQAIAVAASEELPQSNTTRNTVSEVAKEYMTN